jgi:hypothetical protein
MNLQSQSQGSPSLALSTTDDAHSLRLPMAT